MNAAETYAQLFKLASASSEVQEIKKLAQGALGKVLWHPAAMFGLGALTVAGAGIPAALIAKSRAESSAEDERLRTRNLAFGAGVASGLVAPPILRTLSKATGLGLVPGGAGEEEFTSI